MLELPFNNNVIYKSENVNLGKELSEEKWLVAIGDLTFTNYRKIEGKKNFITDLEPYKDSSYYKNFLI